MKNIFLLLTLIFAALSFSFSQQPSYPDFELVESIPVETTLDNPDIRNTQEVWLEMINGAKRSLDIEEFYISNEPGEPLDTVINAIVAAGARGVQVRVIVDARMARTYPATVDMLHKQKNTSVRIINFGALTGGVQHSKYFIVDKKQIFVGSQNFDWRSLKHIHELGLRIANEQAVKMYSDIFELDWNLSEKNDKTLIGKYLKKKSYKVPVKAIEGNGDTLIFTPTMSPKGLITDEKLWDETKIVELISSAKEVVQCQFLSYSPVARERSYYHVLENALRDAAARGVKVEMIVSDWNKEKPTVDYLKSLAVFPNISVKFSNIPDLPDNYVSFARVEHCKYLIIDTTQCWLGTSNWEKGYFYALRNLGVVVKNTRITNTLKNIFNKGWKGPYTELIKPEVQYKAKEHGETRK